MYEDPNPYSDPADDVAPQAPAARRRIGRLPKAALTGGIVAGLALGGTGVGLAVASATSGSSSSSSSAVAASSSSSTSTTVPAKGTHAHPGGRGGFGPGPGGFGGFGGPGGLGGVGGGVVHGVFTVKSGTGYKTEMVQTGTVSAVSSSSITVASADGYSHTYDVVSSSIVDAQAGGISSVAAKDQVSLTATVGTSTDTVADITDLTKLQASRKSFGFGPSTGGAWPSHPVQPSQPSGSNPSGSTSA